MNKTDPKGIPMWQQVMLAAFECSGGDMKKSFTLEDLLVSSWKKEKHTWGLRGYEELYPDLDKVNKLISPRGSGQKGLIDLGYLERVDRRVYRITPAGIAAVERIQPNNAVVAEKVNRELEIAVKQIIEHPVFKKWLADPIYPKYFRDAGNFWGIAPGTPPKTVRDRTSYVEHTLNAALETLNRRGVNEIIEQRGKILFDRHDIERCFDFQKTLKQRFSRELRMLDPNIEL